MLPISVCCGEIGFKIMEDIIFYFPILTDTILVFLTPGKYRYRTAVSSTAVIQIQHFATQNVLIIFHRFLLEPIGGTFGVLSAIKSNFFMYSSGLN
jgi:hypothetical protein